MILTLKRITCRGTYGEYKEEPFLQFRVDGRPWDYDQNWGNPRGVPLRPGESADINRTFQFESNVIVELWECDRRMGTIFLYGNHHLYDFEVTPLQRGRNYVVLGAYLGGYRHYSFTYDVTNDENDILEDYNLTLEHVRCKNAQEYPKDEVFIKVDDGDVWGPTSMKTGDSISLHLPPIKIKSHATIEFWERDTSTRSDHIEHFPLEIDEGYDFGRSHIATFARDWGGNKDATYILQYKVEKFLYIEDVIDLTTLPTDR